MIKNIALLLGLLGLALPWLAKADDGMIDVQSHSASSSNWVDLGQKNASGQELYAVPVLVEKTESGETRVSEVSIADTEQEQKVVASFVWGITANTLQIASVSVGFIITTEEDYGQDRLKYFGRLSGPMIRLEAGFAGFEGAVGFGASDNHHGMIGGGFIGMEIYRPYSQMGAYFGRPGENYVGPRADVMLMGLKATLAVLAKTSSGSGADVIFKLGVGVGL